MQIAIIDARYNYTLQSVKVFLATKKNQLTVIDDTIELNFLIFSQYQTQRHAHRQALKELLAALHINLPSALKYQPKQVMLATYARAIKSKSLAGWLFTPKRQQLSLVDMTTTSGVSKTGTKYVDYHFSATDLKVNRDDVLKQTFELTSPGVWQYQEQAEQRAKPVDLPTNFLLWFDEQGHDRGDKADANCAAKSLQMQGEGLKYLYYQMKFEFADVLYTEDATEPELPKNLFLRQSGLNLTQLLMRHNPRPDAKTIKNICQLGKIPGSAWKF